MVQAGEGKQENDPMFQRGGTRRPLGAIDSHTFRSVLCPPTPARPDRSPWGRVSWLVAPRRYEGQNSGIKMSHGLASRPEHLNRLCEPTRREMGNYSAPNMSKRPIVLIYSVLIYTLYVLDLQNYGNIYFVFCSVLY